MGHDPDVLVAGFFKTAEQSRRSHSFRFEGKSPPYPKSSLDVMQVEAQESLIYPNLDRMLILFSRDKNHLIHANGKNRFDGSTDPNFTCIVDIRHEVLIQATRPVFDLDKLL